MAFQSTHPCGVRLRDLSTHQLLVNFNPRTHVGCDDLKLFDYQQIDNFNPRTHVGCDFVGKEVGNE